MGKSWDVKRQLAPGVSTAQLDETVEAAASAGSTGAKITGAGGDGFDLTYCPAESQTAVRAAMSPTMEPPISIASYGSRVIFNVHRDIWS